MSARGVKAPFSSGAQTMRRLEISLAALALFFCARPLHAIDADVDSMEEPKQTVINIENARFTRYEKDKETGDDCIVLEGDAQVSVESGSTKTSIRADRIRYDRVSQMMYADGGVKLSQTGGASGNDNVSAESLMFNTSTLEGVFDDGRIVQTKSESLNLPAGSTLIVASNMFGKSKSNTIAFKKGRLTFCDDEDPHWRIDASRIWLLPGGEFAFLNALLYVGSVPVLYLPAFYYPKDELLFNPVFAYDRRLGYSIQTTTYVYGRKPLEAATTSTDTSSDSEASSAAESLKELFNFMKPTSLKKQKLEGLVLHNLDEDFTGDTTNFVKIMADWYSNLGITAGAQAAFKPSGGYVTNVEALLRLGFSNTAFREAGTKTYSPFAPSGDKYRDSSNFLGMALPFRYEANLKFSLAKPFTLSLSMPIMSDPFFSNDFTERNETMDWISYLMSSAMGEDEDDTQTEISSFTWNLNASYSPSLPDFFKPFVSSASLSLQSSVAFTSMVNSMVADGIKAEDAGAVRSYSPERKFFYPSQITPVAASLSLSGTLFQYGDGVSMRSAKAADAAQIPDCLAAPDDFKTDAQLQKEKEEREKRKAELAAQKEGGADGDGAQTTGASADGAQTALASEGGAQTTGATEESAGSEGAQEDQTFKFSALVPALSTTLPAQPSVGGVAYKLSYSIRPDISTQIAYSSTGLKEPGDFDWNDMRSYMYSFKMPVTLTSDLSYGGSFASMTNTFSYSPVWQDHPYVSTDTATGGYDKAAEDSLRRADYTATKQTLTNGNTISIKPFYCIPNFRDSGVSYRNDIKIFTTNFIGDADNPDWELLTTDWSDPEFITAHRLDFTFAATEGADDQFGQTLTLSMSLPPQVDEYTGTLALKVPFVTYSVSTGFKRKGLDDDTWVKQDLKQALSVSLFKDKLKFTASYNINLEEEYNDSLKLALNWGPLQAAYQMSYSDVYEFDGDKESVDPATGAKTVTWGKGWEKIDDRTFQPYSFSIAYAPSPKTFYTWKNRVSFLPGLKASIVADFIRPTESYFLFEPSITFKIHEFFSISLSATVRNSSIYRYVQKLFGDDGMLPGETNFFVDLWNSFRFDDEEKRKSSGFKLKSIDLSVDHKLHDWTFNFTYKMSPRLITEDGEQRYDYNPYISISVIWNPMGSMKSEIRDDYGTWKLNP